MSTVFRIIAIILVLFTFACGQSSQDEPGGKFSVDAGKDKTVSEGELVTFVGKTASASSIPQGSIIKWDFGDGDPKSKQLSPKYKFPDDGEYIVTFSITTPEGVKASDKVNVTVVNTSPEVKLEAVPQTCEGKTAWMSATAWDKGINDQITIEWDLDYSGNNFTVDVTESSITKISNYGEAIAKMELDRSWPEAGSKIVAVRASDDDGGVSDITTMAIEIFEEADCTFYGPFITFAQLDLDLEGGFQLGTPLEDVVNKLDENRVDYIRDNNATSAILIGTVNQHTNTLFRGSKLIAENGFLSEIQTVCPFQQCAGCNLVPRYADPYYERSKIEYREGSQETEIAFWKEDTRVYKLESNEVGAVGGGPTYSCNLSAVDLDSFQPRLSIKNMSLEYLLYPKHTSIWHETTLYTHVNYPVALRADGWDPITDQSPLVIWEYGNYSSIATTEDPFTKIWSSPGIKYIYVKAVGSNRLETTTSIKVEVSSHHYKEEGKDLIEAMDKTMLFGIKNLEWDQFIKSELELTNAFQNFKHVVGVDIYAPEGKLIGYKLSSRTPSFTKRWLFEALNQSIKALSLKPVLALDSMDGLRKHLQVWEGDDHYIRILETFDYVATSAVDFEVFYKRSWDFENVSELGF